MRARSQTAQADDPRSPIAGISTQFRAGFTGYNRRSTNTAFNPPHASEFDVAHSPN